MRKSYQLRLNMTVILFVVPIFKALIVYLAYICQLTSQTLIHIFELDLILDSRGVE